VSSTAVAVWTLECRVLCGATELLLRQAGAKTTREMLTQLAAVCVYVRNVRWWRLAARSTAIREPIVIVTTYNSVIIYYATDCVNESSLFASRREDPLTYLKNSVEKTMNDCRC